MNQYVTGAVIRALREKKKLTQAELAGRLSVSDKTISKWETGKGYPDISLLQPLAETFQISLSELLAGEPVTNANVSGNLFRSVFYVCPVCGNILHAMGEADIHCHGIKLTPCLPETPDENHEIRLEVIEEEYYVCIDHPMTKEHYISFMAALSPDGMTVRKLYPEGMAECRLPKRGVRQIVCYCNQDGLFVINPLKMSKKESEVL